MTNVPYRCEYCQKAREINMSEPKVEKTEAGLRVTFQRAPVIHDCWACKNPPASMVADWGWEGGV